MDMAFLSISIAFAGLIISLAQMYSAWGRDSQAYISLIMDFRVEPAAESKSIIQQDLKRCLILEHVASRCWNPKVLTRLLNWEAEHFALWFYENLRNELPFRLLEEADKGHDIQKEISDIEYDIPSSNPDFREKVELAMSIYYYRIRETYPNFCRRIDMVTPDEYNKRHLNIWLTYSRRQSSI